jgi:hypothetical protein
VEQAARREFDNVGQTPAYPSTIGPEAGAAAQDTLGDVRKIINATAEPYYQRAAASR